MNVETPKYLEAMPKTVRPDPQLVGTYYVRSATRPMEHTVDVQLLQCNCESATKGKSRQAAMRHNGTTPFRFQCDHLKKALLSHALLVLEANERRVRR